MQKKTLTLVQLLVFILSLVVASGMRICRTDKRTCELIRVPLKWILKTAASQ